MSSGQQFEIQETVDQAPGISEIAGFWRRAAAAIVDILVLAAYGFAIGFFAEDFLVELGRWGILVGLLISTAYFGVLNSKFFSGQTLGKKLLGIQVVNGNNDTISLAKALVRFLIFGVPGFLGSELVLAAAGSMPLLILTLIPLILVGSGSLYLFAFNRVTRQTVYDLIVGTYVVKIRGEEKSIGKIWRGHFVIFAVLAMIFAGTFTMLMSFVGVSSISRLFEVRQTLIDLPEVIDAGVQVVVNTKIQKTTNKTTKYIVATTTLTSNQISNPVLANKIRKIVEAGMSKQTDVNGIVVVLSYGYNIGIASRFRHHTHRFKIEK